MSKTPEQLRANFRARHGYLPGQPKPASNAEVLATMTPAQKKAAAEAIASLPAAGAGNPGAGYGGADFQTLIENYRDRRKCSYTDAYAAVLRTEQGQQAHRAFLKAKNPHINFEE
jgi:hypothetical protein